MNERSIFKPHRAVIGNSEGKENSQFQTLTKTLGELIHTGKAGEMRSEGGGSAGI